MRTFAVSPSLDHRMCSVLTSYLCPVPSTSSSITSLLAALSSCLLSSHSSLVIGFWSSVLLFKRCRYISREGLLKVNGRFSRASHLTFQHLAWVDYSLPILHTFFSAFVM